MADAPESVLVAVRALLRGAPAEEALALLRLDGKGERRSLASYRTVVSDARRIVLAMGARHQGYAASAAAFRRAVAAHPASGCDAAMRAFFAADLPTQARMHARYGGGRAVPARGWSRAQCLSGEPQVDAAFRAIRLLPDNVAALRLTPEEADAVADGQASSLERKNEEVVAVSDAGALLDRCREIVRGEHGPGTTMAMLAVSLLLLSGRRLTEVLSLRSEFLPPPSPDAGPNACSFKGQLKAGGAAAAYCIPLLVDFASFARGVAELRARQGEAWAGKTNRQIGKYSGNLTDCLKKHFSDVLPPPATPHTLRAVYARMVHEAFDCGSLSLPKVVMISLGHSAMGVSLHYMSTSLRRFEPHRGELGPFPCQAVRREG